MAIGRPGSSDLGARETSLPHAPEAPKLGALLRDSFWQRLIAQRDEPGDRRQRSRSVRLLFGYGESTAHVRRLYWALGCDRDGLAKDCLDRCRWFELRSYDREGAPDVGFTEPQVPEAARCHLEHRRRDRYAFFLA